MILSENIASTILLDLIIIIIFNIYSKLYKHI